ncbi:MAG: energy transducer TonB [Candidatus Acidiferrales bacterium]
MNRKSRLLAIGLAVILGGSAAVTPKLAAQENSSDAAKRKVRTKVTPNYPMLAKQMNVSGKVKIEATIAPDGHVTATRIVGGSPLLVSSATDALKKWRYEPASRESTEIVEFDFSAHEQN